MDGFHIAGHVYLARGLAGVNILLTPYAVSPGTGFAPRVVVDELFAYAILLLCQFSSDCRAKRRRTINHILCIK